MSPPADPDSPRRPPGQPPEGLDPDPYRELFERSADAILIIDGDRFVDCNRATVEMLRYQSKAELLKTHPSELSPPTQPDGRQSFEKANEMIATAFERGSHRFEWEHQRADGEVFPVEVLLTSVPEPGRRTLHVVWRDITERKRLESQLRHAQKMEAIGKLAGGIAHDFNNLLVAIIGHTDLLTYDLQNRPDLLEHLEEIRNAGDRAAALVKQLLAFGRKQKIQPRVFDLNEVLRNLDRLLRRLIGEDVHLESRTTEDPLPIRSDPGQVEQMVVNLVTNSRDAMPGGGPLTLVTEEVAVTTAEAEADQQLAPGRYAALTVIDTGEGMDEATVRRAFDPFFTTKPVGEGTGLGLATVYGIVEQNGGRVTIASSPGGGTTVRVLLPLASAIADDLAAVAPADLPATDPGGQETILVAEDEPAVSTLVVEVLESYGYEVIHAENGRVALEKWRDHWDHIDLLLSDVVMPEMGGVDLLQALRREGFSGPVLFASGYTAESVRRLEEIGEPIDLLEKPFTPDEIARRVRHALDRR